jgi:arylformamidase
VLENRKITDLTRVLDDSLEIYQAGTYSDPQLRIKPWTDFGKQGFSVSQLTLGTQTGTHIDAPAHFIEGGATLDQLPAEHLLGSYFWVDPDFLVNEEKAACLLSKYRSEPILFFAGGLKETLISEAALQILCRVSSKLWVTAGTITVLSRDPFYFHRYIAGRGIFLVEDLDPNAAAQVKPGGELIALPLRFSGTSGSPCRVLALQFSAPDR